MQVSAKIQINSFEVDAISRQTARIKAAFIIGNMPTGMNPFSCSIQLSDVAQKLLEELIAELAKGVGEKIQEQI